MSERARTLLSSKQRAAAELAHHVPPRPLTTRPLRVRESVGFGAERWGVQLITLAAEPLSAAELSLVARLQARARGKATRTAIVEAAMAKERHARELGLEIASEAVEVRAPERALMTTDDHG